MWGRCADGTRKANFAPLPGPWAGTDGTHGRIFLALLGGGDAGGDKAAAVYARVSTGKQSEAGNLERQRLRLMEYAAVDGGWPGLSVVVAARDEARGAAAALSALLAQDYPGMRAVLDRLASGRPNVEVVHVHGLPPGWLGKTHALGTGAKRVLARPGAEDRLLLFTGADVCLAAGSLRRAVVYAARHGLDHLTLVPSFAVRGFWLQCWCVFTGMSVASFLSPRTINRHRSRRDRRLQPGARPGLPRGGRLRGGGDAPRRRRRLGQRLRQGGARQRMGVEPDLVSVAWYGSLGAALRGLEKNALPVLDYRVGLVAAACVGTLTLFLAPVALLVLARGPARWLAGLTVAMQWAATASCADVLMPDQRPSPRALVLGRTYPAGAALYTLSVARSGWMTLRRGGIAWRDTFYPLAALRPRRRQRKP